MKYGKKIDVLKPQTLVPRYFLGIYRRNSDGYLSIRRNFLGIFSFNRANISRKLKSEFRGNSYGNYSSDPRFYNHEPLLLPLRLLSLLSGDLPFLSDDISGESSLNLHKSCKDPIPLSLVLFVRFLCSFDRFLLG